MDTPESEIALSTHQEPLRSSRFIIQELGAPAADVGRHIGAAAVAQNEAWRYLIMHRLRGRGRGQQRLPRLAFSRSLWARVPTLQRLRLAFHLPLGQPINTQCEFERFQRKLRLSNFRLGASCCSQ